VDTDFQNILNKLNLHTKLHISPFLTEETYILAIENVFNMVVITDCEGVVQYANPAVERITGFARKEVIGKKVGAWGGHMKKSFYEDLWKTIVSGNVFISEIENMRKNGDHYTARLTISPIKVKNRVLGFVGTEEDITLERKLQKEKDDFISLASHQLRTPLGAIKWNLELLMSEYPHLQKMLGDLNKQNQTMIDLVNRFLLVLRITDNRTQTVMKEVDIDNLISTIISQFQTKVKERNIIVEIKKRKMQKKLLVMTDGLLMKEIIFNLLDNAIKFSNMGGRIEICTSITRSHWNFSIVDNGIGIPAKDIPLIINKFHRASNTIGISGTGLGMYIANTFVSQLKGKLKVISSIHKKTEVVCIFPLDE